MSKQWGLSKDYLEPILPFLNDPDVTEIMVNKFDSIYIKKKGSMQKVEASFKSEAEVSQAIKQIAVATGQVADDVEHPEVNARLWNKARFCGCLYPWSAHGSNMTIRLFPERVLTGADLVEFGSLTQTMLDFIKLAVSTHVNILVSGSTDSGKTTLLNILTSFIDPKERLITVEDVSEIQSELPNWISHIAIDRTSKSTGKIVKSLADLIRLTLRENPSRLVVGEIRDSDSVLAFMRALGTGHKGGMATIHANDPEDAIYRMVDLLEEGGKGYEPAKRQAWSNLELVIQAEEVYGSGKRVVAVTEVSRNGNYNTLFEYDYVHNKHVINQDSIEQSSIYKRAKKYGYL